MLMAPKYKIGELMVMMVSNDQEIVVKIEEIFYDDGKANNIDPGFEYAVRVANTSTIDFAREERMVRIQDYNGN